MRVLAFCEGARSEAGGVGLIAAPLIHRALAQRGHTNVLAITGKMMSTAHSMMQGPDQPLFEEHALGVTAIRFGSIGRSRHR